MAGCEMTFLPLTGARRPSRRPQPQLPLSLTLKPSSKSLAVQYPNSQSLRLSHGSASLVRCRLDSPIRALDSNASHPSVHGLEKANAKSRDFDEWDLLTAKFAGAANVPFLLLQLPQIILNARNLMAGNKAALFAVPWLELGVYKVAWAVDLIGSSSGSLSDWMGQAIICCEGMLTGLLGNLSLLSYFAKKRETEAVLVQTLGVVSTYVVIAQLAMAESMPLPQFAVTTAAVASGLILNFLNYFNLLQSGIWLLWEDFITVGGLAVLPQVMWSTFVPFVPNSILPGAFAFLLAVVAVVMARTGKLSEKVVKLVASLSGWTATLLFMWMPVAQMWTSYLNPDNIKGLSAFTMLLAMIGNGLMIPRALFTRDLMWFTGSAWASFLHGWGNLICMYCFKSISKEFFLAATVGFLLWLGYYYSILGPTVIWGYFTNDNELFVDDAPLAKLVAAEMFIEPSWGLTLWKDSKAYGYGSPVRSLKELVFGR